MHNTIYGNLKPVKSTFTLSQQKEFSRWSHIRNENAFAPLPHFNTPGFTHDLKKMIHHSNDLLDLKRNILSISDDYIWPATTFTMIIKNKERFDVSGLAERQILTREELEIDNPRSFFNYIAKQKRTGYVPKVDFVDCRGFYMLPEDVSIKLEKGQPITMSGIPDINELGIEYSSLAKMISKHSWAMVFTPLFHRNDDFGMMIFTYASAYLFGPEEGDPGLDYMRWFHMLSDATSVSLEKMVKLGQKLQ